MKGAVDDNFLDGIVNEHAKAGKAAAQNGVKTFRGGVEHVFEFGQQVLKVTIHGQHVFARNRRESVLDGVPDAVGRRPDHRRDAGIGLGKGFDDVPSFIGTVVIDKYNLVNVVVVIAAQAVDQWRHVHHFVVAWNDYRNPSF